jgi:MraZ protein
VLLTGQYEHVIDAKQRLAIPADIRSQWRPEQDGGAWYAVPWPNRTIRLYPEARFRALAEGRSQTLTPDEEEAEVQVALFGFSRRLEMDAAGRIRLPEDMLDMTQLSGEVTLVGAGDRLEIHDRNTWRSRRDERLHSLPEMIKRSQKRG